MFIIPLESSQTGALIFDSTKHIFPQHLRSWFFRIIWLAPEGHGRENRYKKILILKEIFIHVLTLFVYAVRWSWCLRDASQLIKWKGFWQRQQFWYLRQEPLPLSWSRDLQAPLINLSQHFQTQLWHNCFNNAYNSKKILTVLLKTMLLLRCL